MHDSSDTVLFNNSDSVVFNSSDSVVFNSSDSVVLSRFYFMLFLHATLALFDCTHRAPRPRHETFLLWLLLGSTSVLAGRSEERWTLALVVSEVHPF
jgi:hypothetical protein